MKNWSVPAGACDCHMHIYEDRFPLVPQATFKPPHAPLTDYLQVQRELGFSRAVIVQPNGYGFDNSCTLEALASLGDVARGIATVPPDVTDVELERLTRAGVRGVRFHLLPGGMLTWDSLEPMAARIAAFGWHVQLQLDGRELPRYEATLQRLPVPLVIDHNGKFLEPVAIDHPGFKALLGLLAGGNTWVKLSAPYSRSVASTSSPGRRLIARAAMFTPVPAFWTNVRSSARAPTYAPSTARASASRSGSLRMMNSTGSRSSSRCQAW